MSMKLIGMLVALVAMITTGMATDYTHLFGETVNTTIDANPETVTYVTTDDGNGGTITMVNLEDGTVYATIMVMNYGTTTGYEEVVARENTYVTEHGNQTSYVLEDGNTAYVRKTTVGNSMTYLMSIPTPDKYVVISAADWTKDGQSTVANELYRSLPITEEVNFITMKYGAGHMAL
jgi:hypothetical protein